MVQEVAGPLPSEGQLGIPLLAHMPCSHTLSQILQKSDFFVECFSPLRGVPNVEGEGLLLLVL